MFKILNHRTTEYQVGRDLKKHLVQPFLAKAQPRKDGPALCKVLSWKCPMLGNPPHPAMSVFMAAKEILVQKYPVTHNNVPNHPAKQIHYHYSHFLMQLLNTLNLCAAPSSHSFAEVLLLHIGDLTINSSIWVCNRRVVLFMCTMKSVACFSGIKVSIRY